MSTNNVTSYRWEIADFRKQYWEAVNKNENLVSDVFTLVTRPSIQVALFFNIPSLFDWEKCTYGVILKNCDIDQSLNFDLKIWMENEDGQKFGEYSARNHEFKTIGDQCGFYVICTGNDTTLFDAIYNNDKTLFICCELLELNPSSTSVENCVDEFHQDQWKLYEEEIHDAVIKVNDKEFKILKSFFMAHSSVFKSMFLSKFKEGITSKIQVNDVDEDTMEYLIKWMYTGQLESEAPIEALFAASDKYDIKILKKMCADRMRLTLTKDNAFNRLVLALMHSDTQLKDTILNFISGLPTNAFTNFLASDEWLDFHNKNPGAAKEVAKSIREKMNA